ncbi:MAG: hypothetical protein J0L77_02805 [Alphaproteobacteria bacterium]|nr:hypothetical protein [Alphaproteobacteria bacterium]
MTISDKKSDLHGQEMKKIAREFKEGWDAAAAKAAQDPTFIRLCDDLGIHPDRRLQFSNDWWNPKIRDNRSIVEMAKDYTTPVVIPFSQGEPKPINS